MALATHLPEPIQNGWVGKQGVAAPGYNFFFAINSCLTSRWNYPTVVRIEFDILVIHFWCSHERWQYWITDLGIDSNSSWWPGTDISIPGWNMVIFNLTTKIVISRLLLITSCWQCDGSERAKSGQTTSANIAANLSHHQPSQIVNLHVDHHCWYCWDLRLKH